VLEQTNNLIDLPVNLGLSGAFMAGMRYAYQNSYDAVLQFDADGQHISDCIPDMVETLKEGNNVVIGSRFLEQKKHRSLRMLGNLLISFAIKLTTRVNIIDSTSGMRMFDKSIIKFYATQKNMTPEPDTLAFLIKNGAKVKEVAVKMRNRQAGESYLTATKSVKYMLRMAISIIVLQLFRN
jgi:glycosyltransferase involved in cell wall biosynthesis